MLVAASHSWDSLRQDRERDALKKRNALLNVRGGPQFLMGQLETYKTLSLSGIASRVDFLQKESSNN